MYRSTPVSVARGNALPIDNTSQEPMYPWSMRIVLDDEQVRGLGLEDLPPDTALKLLGSAKITSVEVQEMKDGSKKRTMTVQITELSAHPVRGAYDPTKSFYKPGGQGGG